MADAECAGMADAEGVGKVSMVTKCETSVFPDGEADDYERWANQFDVQSRQDNMPVARHVVAGSVAGVCEHVMLFPIDTIRTRMQAFSLNPLGITNSLKAVNRELGLGGFFRGTLAVCTGCIPAHAGLFLVYEWGKRRLDTSRPAHGLVCGGLASIAHDTIMTPTDVVKQRLQLGCYRNAFHCVKSIISSEGLPAFFRSLPTSVLMNLPYGAIMVATNEWAKHRLLTPLRGASLPRDTARMASQHTHTKSTAAYFAIAGLSGGLAGFLTTPLDLVKTRLQTQVCRSSKEMTRDARSAVSSSIATKPQSTVCSITHTRTEPVFIDPPKPKSRFGKEGVGYAFSSARNSTTMAPPKYQAFGQAVRTILKEEGVRGFWRGALPRTAVSIPSAAICWGTYHFVVNSLASMEQ